MTAPSTQPSTHAGTTGRLLDEAAGLLVPVVMPVVRRLPALILVVSALCTVMALLALVGAARDDAEIDKHSAVATAQVLPGSGFNRTLITFNTPDGASVTPEHGVFYPRGLQPGQIVRVEYDVKHTDRVRVLGRDHSVGYLPTALMLVGLWAVALPVAFHLRGKQLRRMEAERLAAMVAQ